jgi:hypothetical protein
MGRTEMAGECLADEIRLQILPPPVLNQKTKKKAERWGQKYENWISFCPHLFAFSLKS